LAEILPRFGDPFASKMEIRRKCIHFGWEIEEIEEKERERERERERM